MERTSSAPVQRDVQLPATAAAAGLARRELTAIPGVAGELGYKVLLLASELISSVVQDADPDPQRTLWLSVRAEVRVVRVEVGGRDPRVPVRRALSSEETPSLGGYGLRIVERMADRWGTAGDDGTTIWFELDR